MTNEESKQQRSLLMSRIRGTNTSIELLLRKKLFANGFRYRVNFKNLPGTPDIVLPKFQTVIFVHGCFWHGHDGCKHYKVPKTNTEFWTAKIARNQERDQETWRQLEAKGWYVIIVWECQLKKAVLDETIARVEAEIRQNGKIHLQLQDERRKAREAYAQEQMKRKVREATLKTEISKKNLHQILSKV